MDKVFTPDKKIKKQIIFWLSASEFLVLMMLMNSLVSNYGILPATIFVGLVIIASIGFNFYIWNKMSNEYMSLQDDYFEWNGIQISWGKIEESRIRKEEGKTMFLIFRVEGEYLKIPLRLYQNQSTDLIASIKEKVGKIAGP